MFRTVLIANRGEIALRVLRACADLGIRAVAVYSEADARALHVRQAAESYCLGPSPAADSYLNLEAILAAARASGAEAVHPGYGFLSESPAFARACAAHGAVFVGPPAAAMEQLGNKAAAKALARRVGVPVVPGYDGAEQGAGALLARAREVGFPLLIKAAAGGGGRGMRVVEAAQGFQEALAAAQREARAAFGDDAVLLERRVPSPRHIEFQVLADAHGSVIHLGERDCSIQRRQQKVVEESPSLALTPRLRRQMGEATVALARAAGYVNAGTVEFIVDSEGQFYFLEANTRLQVEHPVTEQVTGVDLVQEQLRIAAGEPLSLRQAAIGPRGHAIEWRVYAEDPARGFAPSGGPLLAFAPPTGPGLRNDVGVATGDTVTTYYDAMLGKLIVSGPDRAACLARSAAALDRYVVLGPRTNLPLLRALARAEAFARGRSTTEFLDAHLAELLPPNGGASAPEEVLLAAAGWRLTAPREPRPDQEEWSPWRSGTWAIASQGLTLRFQDEEQEVVVIADRRAEEWRLRLGEQEWVLGFARVGEDQLLVRSGAHTWVARVAEAAGALHVAVGAQSAVLRSIAAVEDRDQPPPAPAGDGHDALRARMPGVVVQVKVGEGERVIEGQTLLILDSMKTEHLITAPRTGVVRALPYGVGDQVAAGATLVELSG